MKKILELAQNCGRCAFGHTDRCSCTKFCGHDACTGTRR